jgi:hypothetical protein
MNFAAEWQDKAIRDGENRKGDQFYLPICREEVQQSKMQKESHPVE